MSWFRVSGVTTGGEQVAVTVEASDSEKALFLGWASLDRDYRMCELEMPVVRELPTDQSLRASGARSLFDVGMVG